MTGRIVPGRVTGVNVPQFIGWASESTGEAQFFRSRRGKVAKNDAVTTPLTIAAVSYLNTLPLIHGLDTWAGGSVVRAVPSRIGPMLLSGDADLGLASVVDYARSEGQLALLDAGMIGCDGETLTVRLFSSVPIEQITRVRADTDSHTSHVLCDLILRERYGVTAEFVEFDYREQSPEHAADEADDAPEASLMIGDKVVTRSPPAVRSPHQIDLGAAWNELTGLPFIYACWMCRRERADDPDIRNAAAMLDHARRRNRSRIDRIVTDGARDLGWPGDLARQYIGELLRFDVDERAKEGARAFLALASEHGLLPECKPEWTPAAAPAAGAAAACQR